MHIMAAFRGNRAHSFALAVLCLSLALAQGCARSDSLHRNATSPASQQKLPFHPAADQSAPADGTVLAAAADPKAPASLPFHESPSRVLPSGTLLTVQLQDSLSTRKVHAGDPFTASVTAPLTLDGDTLIEPGTTVTGSVESSRVQLDRPGTATGSGYFRLSLSSMNVAGRQLALQTSSLFARGTFQQADGVRVPKGRHLTFRLTAPVTLDDSKAAENRTSPAPNRE